MAVQYEGYYGEPAFASLWSWCCCNGPRLVRDPSRAPGPPTRTNSLSDAFGGPLQECAQTRAANPSSQDLKLVFRADITVERHRSPATITTVPRGTLADVRHKEVDAVLKDLRHCSRRLRSALGCFEDELRILERSYYKCKNQHRMALFFKRVAEMRRYGRRLSELGILERVDLLRASFVGLKHTGDRKALRGSWTHVPEQPHVYFLMERLTACSTLVCKMRECLKSAYHHFTLAMQTGAFVQHIILFVGISSRMSVLSSELEEALQLSIPMCHRLSVIIHPAGMHATDSPPEPESSPLAPLHVDYDPLEDTSLPVSRCEPIDPSTAIVENLSVKTGMGMGVMPPSGQATNAGDHTATQASKMDIVKVAQKSRRKNAKKKFDEIDEIFGF